MKIGDAGFSIPDFLKYVNLLPLQELVLILTSLDFMMYL